MPAVLCGGGGSSTGASPGAAQSTVFTGQGVVPCERWHGSTTRLHRYLLGTRTVQRGPWQYVKPPQQGPHNLQRTRAESLRAVDGQRQPFLAQDCRHVLNEVVAVFHGDLHAGLLPVPDLRTHASDSDEEGHSNLAAIASVVIARHSAEPNGRRYSRCTAVDVEHIGLTWAVATRDT